MELSVTLRTPLDQYVDNYFTSKVKDLAKAFKRSESEVEYVLEFGVRELKRAPSRRSSSRESKSSSPVKLILEPSSPVSADIDKTVTLISDSVSPKPPPVEPVALISDSVSPKPLPTKKCVHQIKGVNPRICERGAKHTFENKWYCKTHLKIYTKTPLVKKKGKNLGEAKSIAKKIWQKKTLEKKFNFVEEDNYYVDTHTRICISPNSKEAFGILPENGDALQPLQEEHLELLAASNLKYRETTSHLDSVFSESDDELILLSSEDSE